MDRPRGVRVLTVGDGDLSFSLALARAFRGDELFLTATTLLTADELRETYGNAAPILAELSMLANVKVLHGVDATSLDVATVGLQDHVIFNHPHLGLADLKNVEAHSRRHRVLLAHFLETSASLLTKSSSGGQIHLLLCGNQPSAWLDIDDDDDDAASSTH